MNLCGVGGKVQKITLSEASTWKIASILNMLAVLVSWLIL